MILLGKQPLTEKELFGFTGITASIWSVIALGSNLIYGVIGFFIIFSIYFFISPVFKKKYKEYYFEERQLLKDEEIFLNYYAESNFNEQTILLLWKEIACIFKVPPGKLRPTDIFGLELGGFHVFSNPEIEELESAITSHLKKYNNTVSLPIRTLDDYIRSFA